MGNRYFTLVLLTTLIVFILTLSRQSWSSRREVALGLNRPPPPPPAWEKFPFLKRYYGGVRTLIAKAENTPEYPNKDGDSVSEERKVDEIDSESQKRNDRLTKSIPPSETYDPYPNYNSAHVAVRECFLAEDQNGRLRIPPVRAYNGVPKGMPDPVMGSYDLFGLRNDVCFERFGRLGPYGIGYSRRLGGTGAEMEGDREGAEQVWKDVQEVDWRKVDWADAQRRCEEANKHRFKAKHKDGAHFFQVRSDDGGPQDESADHQNSNDDESKLLPRTVILIRTWHDFPYNDEHIVFLRSLFTELALMTGAEFTIHFLIHVKDADQQIWADDEIYQRVLNESLPTEFRGMGTLWSEPQMAMLYPALPETNYRNLGVYGVYRSAWMPVMFFAHQHPEYDYYWNAEMDVRYTGHWYEFLTKVSNWAKQQPRKGLWERNARFYIPSEHGTWDDFSHMVRVQTEHGTAGKSNLWAGLSNDPDVPDDIKEQVVPKAEKPVWGPEPPIDDTLDNSTDVNPPATADKSDWGVGEEADLITFNPIFDPQGTTWILGDDTTGYNTTRSQPKRRTTINTFNRLSKRLLLAMYRDTLLGRKTMFTEMWPASCALLHGFKAVYAPHPVYIDRRWPTSFLAATFNAGRNGATGGSRLSVFSDDRQHNFRGTTWYYDAGFAPNLWKRWLGYKVDNDGGEMEEVAGEGRMCLPSILLHPVKGVDLIFQHEEGESEGLGS